jgi:hypothetical protein
LALLQSLDERDKQAKLFENLTKKFIIIENEKNELENLVIIYFDNFSKVTKKTQEYNFMNLIGISA